MTLLLRDGLELGKELLQVAGVRVWDFVLEVEEDTLSRRDCYGVLALILLYQLPERTRPVILLEGYGHDLVLLDLGPLYAIYWSFKAYFSFFQSGCWCQRWSHTRLASQEVSKTWTCKYSRRNLKQISIPLLS